MTAPIRQKIHIPQVDYIRAIASIAVALFHLGGKALPVLNYGWLGVYMFFLVSGFIICWAIPRNYTWKMSGRFISRRIIRIEPPYIISIGLAILVKLIMMSHYRPDWFNVLSHFAYLNSFLDEPYLSPVYWTLGIEFQFYLFVALCFPFFVKRWGACFLLLLSVLSVLIKAPGSNLLNAFPPFALGILYYLYLSGDKNLRWTFFWGVLITACCIHAIGWLQTCATLFALGLLMAPLKSYPIITFFSKISFSLYLTHDMIGSNLVVYMGAHLPKTLIFKGISFLTGILISVLFAYFFYRLVEAPFLKLSKRINYGLKKVSQPTL